MGVILLDALRAKMPPERIIPDEEPPGIVALHLKRYEFARAYVADKRVADVACGVGYGSHYLSDLCCQIIGVDIDGDALTYAAQRYSGPNNLAFIRADAEILGLRTAQFDVVCSFETIEHVEDVHRYLSEIKRVLSPGGYFIVSTPCVVHTTTRPRNPFHRQEWSPKDFEILLDQYFDQVQLFGQKRRQTLISTWLKRFDFLNLRILLLPLGLTQRIARASGVRATPDSHLVDVLIQPGDLRRASEIIAVAFSQPLDSDQA